MIFTLHSFPGGIDIAAESEGLAIRPTSAKIELSHRENWPPAALAAPAGWRTAIEIEQLLELGFAEAKDGKILVPYRNLATIDAEMPVSFPRAWVQPSPFLLKIDRKSDIGRKDFEYKYQFLIGGRPVHLDRLGPYVRRAGSNEAFILDQQMYSLVQAMDSFNALPPEQKTSQNSWLTFAKVKGCAKDVGAILDAALQKNDVVVPSTIGLDIREDADGALSFLPTCPELASEEFHQVFERNPGAEKLYSLDRPGLGRVRIVLSDEQHEVLRRMKRVRRVTGKAKEHLLQDPAQVFEGVIDHVELPYSERVIGIGEFQFTPMPRSAFRDVTMAGLWEQPTTTRPEGEPLDGSVVAQDPRNGGSVSSETAGAPTTNPQSADAPEPGEPSARHPASDPIEPAQPASSTQKVLLVDNNDERVRATFLEAAKKAMLLTETAQFQCPSAFRPELKLHPHQQYGVRWLQTCIQIPGRNGVLLADDMGVGKTIQILTFLAWCIEAGKLPELAKPAPPFRPILIVVPLILLETRTWEKEMERFFANEGSIFWPVLSLHGSKLGEYRRDDAEGPELLIGKPILDLPRLQRYRVVITNYETLKNYQHSFAYYLNGKPLWSAIIADEAQEFKVPNSKISHAMKALKGDFQIACTGTPVENRLLDLWNICDTVQPGLLSSAKEFMEQFESSANHGDPNGNLEELKRTLLFQQPHAFLLRRNKSDVADLPPKQVRKIPCNMSNDEIELHLQLLNELRADRSQAGIFRTLHRFALLSQHPALLIGNAEDSSSEELIAASPKLQALISELHKIRGKQEKAIIFARHRAMQSILAKVLSSEFGVPVRIINGETKTKSSSFRAQGQKTRSAILDEFKRKPGFNVLVLSPFVAGIGLTITEANHVFHYGRWWNPAVESQATDRVYRIGQDKEVSVYVPIYHDPSGHVPVTFDERLDALMGRKYRLAEEFFKPLPPEDEIGGELVNEMLN
jgi:hypothetical protein